MTSGIPGRAARDAGASRFTKPGIILTIVVVLAGSAAQLIGYGFFGNRIGLLDSAADGGAFGAVGDIALAAAAVSAWTLAVRARSARPVAAALAVLLTFLAADKVTRLHEHIPHWLAFYLPVLTAAFVCLVAVARGPSRVSRDRGHAATDQLIGAGLALLAFSFLVHVSGDRLLVALGASTSGWAYQVKAVAKHGTEVAGWLLTALGLLRLAGPASFTRGLAQLLLTESGAVRMQLGYAVRSSFMMLGHPREGVERVRGRIDRRSDRRELAALGRPPSEHYAAVPDWSQALHKAIDVPWPCQESEQFGEVWDATVSGLEAAGLRVGLASYRGWNDGDRAQAEAIWCLVAHTRPANVVETGVAHGLISRVILERLERNGTGHLSSVDLPAVDPALHREIGVAIPEHLRSRWTYVAGTSRQRLPGLVRRLGQVDLFVHDSLHTARNTCFELDTVWPALAPAGVAVVDDIDHSLGFSRFTERAAPQHWLAARHITGSGVWGIAVKAGSRAQPRPAA